MTNRVLVRRFRVTLLCWLLVATLLASLNACTHAKHQDSLAIPKFQSVAIVNKGVSDELKARFGVPQEDSGSDAGALEGAGTGAMFGAHASKLCMEFTILCALATVPAGALIGAVGGGLTADSQNKLSEDQLLDLEYLFAQILQQRTINQDIESSLFQHVPAGRLKKALEADTLLQFRLYDVRFSNTTKDKFALTLKTVMLIKWGRNSPRAMSTHRTYEQTSHSLQLEDWIKDDGDTLNLAFDTCIEGLTKKMLEDIQFETL